MPSFNDLKELERYVNQIAKKAMNQGSAVKSAVIEEGERQVQETVYDVYTPKVYERSGQLKESWETEETSDGIAIYNIRKDGSKDVAEVVETGQGYQFDFEYNGVARPFTENTRKVLDGNSKLTDALRKDMKSIGLNVE